MKLFFVLIADIFLTLLAFVIGLLVGPDILEPIAAGVLVVGCLIVIGSFVYGTLNPGGRRFSSLGGIFPLLVSATIYLLSVFL